MTTLYILRLQINPTSSIVPNWTNCGDAKVFASREKLDAYIAETEKFDPTCGGLVSYPKTHKRRWHIRTVTFQAEEFRPAR